MAAQASAISTYYVILGQLSLVLAAFLVFKFGSLYLMVLISKWFTDDENPKAEPKQKKLRSGRGEIHRMGRAQTILWFGLGAVLLASGLIQIIPVLVTAPAGEIYLYALHGLPQPGFIQGILEYTSRLWFSHGLWFNIWAVLIQLALALLILTSHGRWLGWIAVYLSGILGGLIWIFWEAFGGLFADLSVVQGNPGAGLWIVFCVVLLVLPSRFWETGRVHNLLRWAFVGYWTYAVVVQARFIFLPDGARRFGTLIQIAARKSILGSESFPAMSAQWFGTRMNTGAWWEAVLVLGYAAAAVLTAKSLWNRFGTGVELGLCLISWWFGQQFGFLPSMGLGIGAAPIAAMLVVVRLASKPRSRARWHAQRTVS